MATHWTDQEYGTLARALLYPGSRAKSVVSGFVPAAYALGWQLDGRLQQVDEGTKQQALLLAQQIEAGEAALLGGLSAGGCGGQRGAVLQVGDIRLDPRLGRSEREALLSRARERLALMIDFQVNPNANLTAGGGISGTWGR